MKSLMSLYYFLMSLPHSPAPAWSPRQVEGNTAQSLYGLHHCGLSPMTVLLPHCLRCQSQSCHFPWKQEGPSSVARLVVACRVLAGCRTRGAWGTAMAPAGCCCCCHRWKNQVLFPLGSYCPLKSSGESPGRLPDWGCTSWGRG